MIGHLRLAGQCSPTDERLSDRIHTSTTFAIREALGSVARTRTQTAFCASTFPKAPTSAGTPSANLMRLLRPSTADLERLLNGRRRPRLSTGCYPWHAKP